MAVVLVPLRSGGNTLKYFLVVEKNPKRQKLDFDCPLLFHELFILFAYTY